MLKVKAVLAGLLALMLVPLCALAVDAQDMTGMCQIRCSRNGNDKARLTDDRYMTYWNGGPEGWLEITAPEDTPCYGLYVRWAEELTGYRIEVPDGEGWKTAFAMDTAPYYNEYIPLDGLTHFRLAGSGPLDLCVTEIQMLSEGRLPQWVEQWEPFTGQADLLILVGHPDDEILWFGGMIPYYRGELGKKVLVAVASQQPASRKCELLDCLWTCGVREYPVVTGGDQFPDRYRSSAGEIFKIWGEENLTRFAVSLLRQYRPKVAIAHDFNGEYGHGAHRACAQAMANAVQLAADASYEVPGQELPPWQVQKLYVHLYPENEIVLDWSQPLDHFQGRSALTVAKEAFKRHRTQDHGKYAVRDEGKYDCRRFGLYYSAVGPDEDKNDIFENIE